MEATRTALVTGASGGIGEEFARLLAVDGYRLVLVARREDTLVELAKELGGGHRAIAADLSCRGEAERVAVEAGPVDVLINNAGHADFGPFAEADLAKTVGMMELNVASLTVLTRLVVEGMLERGKGRILNVASTAAFQAGPLMSVYYATKAYVLSFSEALAEELRGTGVTVTALCPGTTASGFQARAEMESSRLVKGRTLARASDVARIGYRAMQRGDVVVVPGLRNKILASSVRFTPRPVLRRLVHQMQKPTR
jgi:short-subunit dehydrogenase